MLPLIRMDWILLRPILLKTSPLILLALGVGVSGPRGLIAMGVVLAEFLVGFPIFHDLGPHTIEPYIRALPVSPAELVGARYLSGLLGLSMGLLLPVVTAVAARTLGLPALQEMTVADALAGQGVLAVLLGTLFFLYLPFHFRFGGERGLGFFTALLLAGLALPLAHYGWMRASDLALRGATQLLERPILQLWAFLGWMLLGAGSLGLSLLGYRQRLASPQGG